MTGNYWTINDEDDIGRSRFEAEIKMLLNVICLLATASLALITLSIALGYSPFAMLGITLFAICFSILILIASVLERETGEMLPI